MPWPVFLAAWATISWRRAMTRRGPDDRNLKKSDIVTVVVEAPKE